MRSLHAYEIELNTIFFSFSHSFEVYVRRFCLCAMPKDDCSCSSSNENRLNAQCATNRTDSFSSMNHDRGDELGPVGVSRVLRNFFLGVSINWHRIAFSLLLHIDFKQFAFNCAMCTFTSISKRVNIKKNDVRSFFYISTELWNFCCRNDANSHGTNSLIKWNSPKVMLQDDRAHNSSLLLVIKAFFMRTAHTHWI